MSTQRQVTHPAGTLPICSCNQPAKHYLDARARRVNGGHFLECARCDRRTARHPHPDGAIAEFHRLVGTTPATTARTQNRVCAIR